jgi:predicted nucleotidyltransferase component of viral defense system
MLELLKTRLKDHPRPFEETREFLQLLLLKIIDEKGYFQSIAFMGGTALRILYNLNRFSEDLDFALTNKKTFLFSKFINTLKKELELQNFSVTVTYKENKVVSSAFFKFEHLLFDLNLSPHKDERLSIKLEVDQQPPSEFITSFTLLNKMFLTSIHHYDLPSLFSGKLHAVLFRKYTKGRDFYDLMWFIGKKINPNYTLLTNAILQTENIKLQIDSKKLIELLTQKIQQLDFKKIRSDISPFLADPNEIRFFEKDLFLSLIKGLI